MNWRSLFSLSCGQLRMQPLRLHADRAEDVMSLSCCLEDGRSQVGDLSYQPAHGQFSLQMARRIWEPVSVDDAGGEIWRIQSDVTIGFVRRVQCRNIDQRDRRRRLIIQGLRLDRRDASFIDDAGELALTLLFGGDAAIRLEIGAIDCYLADKGEPWTVAAQVSQDDHPADQSIF